MGLPWLFIFPVIALVLALWAAPRTRGFVPRLAVCMGFVITASMFPVVVFSTLLEQQVANVRLGATIYCTLILAVMYALFIDIRAKQLRHRLINSWQKYVWYRIDAALTAQEKKAEAELAERRKSGRRLPWWKRLFY